MVITTTLTEVNLQDLSLSPRPAVSILETPRSRRWTSLCSVQEEDLGLWEKHDLTFAFVDEGTRKNGK